MILLLSLVGQISVNHLLPDSLETLEAGFSYSAIERSDVFIDGFVGLIQALVVGFKVSYSYEVVSHVSMNTCMSN